MKRKIFYVLLCTTLTTLMAFGCASKDTNGKNSKAPDAEKDELVFRVACEATTPGWIQMDAEGNLEGYDYDVWQEIGERTGYAIDYKVMEWDGMWSMLETNRIDTVGEQISVTAERKEKYMFSEPYAYNVYCLLSAKANNELQSMADLKSGMTISCETNTSDEIIVDSINEEYAIELTPTYYDGMSVQDVALGRCDLWPRAETSCNTTVKEIDTLRILGKTNILETNAYPFAKSDRGEKLAKLASDAINEMHEDGTLKQLTEKWFGMDITVKPTNAQ